MNARKFVNGSTGIVLHPNRLEQPLRWQKPRRIFVNSLSDLFHEDVPDEFIAAVFGVMAACPSHTFQILTKRPERMRKWFGWVESKRGDLTVSLVKQGGAWPKVDEYSAESVLCAYCARDVLEPLSRIKWAPWPVPNVWLGVSIENQETADERIPLLLQTPAAIRFISYEPALGPVVMPEEWLMPAFSADDDRYHHPGGRGLDWVIAGGESGPGARPMHPDWVRSIRDQCQAAGVPFFFKQWGEWAPGENVERHSGQVQTAHWYNGHKNWIFGRENLAIDGQHRDDEPDLYRIGKKAAGSMLDGREHKEWPR